MKNKILNLAMIFCLPLCMQAKEGRLLRFPTTNGSEIVFSYAGDLYKVSSNGGEAQRLTAHPGYEMFAHYSPDGNNIAFTAQYDGNTEVYLMPSSGGEPVRLTYTSTNERDDLGDRMGPNNIVMAWKPDGKSILYRNRIGDGFLGKLWNINIKGGMPEALPLPEGGFCSYSPDGSKIAYNRVFREFRTWKHYKGGMADDIWIYDPKANKVTNVTNDPSQDIFPMWIGDEIFFLSDRDVTMNLFVYNTKTKAIEKITNYSDYDIKFPSTDGKSIVFEKGGYIFKFNPMTRKAEKVNISLNAEGNEARKEIKNVSENITCASLAPNGNNIAITARGEVFIVPTDKGATFNITRTPGAHERCAQWSPDGKHIAFISDKTGETELYIENVSDNSTVQATKNNDTYIRSINWSPDSKTILYTDRKNRIVLVDANSLSKKVLLENPEMEFHDVDFSPDSQWITYTKPAKNQFSIVYIYNLKNNKEYPVTEKWYNSGSPTFSSDGKYLLFTSDRDLNPIYSNTEWNHAYNKMGCIYLIPLSKDTPSPFIIKAESAIDNSDKEAKSGKDKNEANAESVKIDTDNLAARIVKLPIKAENYWNIFSNGDKVWYYVDGKTNMFDLDSKKETKVFTGYIISEPNKAGNKIVIFNDNDIYVCDLPTSELTLDKAVDLSQMKAEVDYPKEWEQIYNEAWRAYRDGFYLKNMHGIDWNAMKEKYAVLLPYVKCRLDLNYVIGGLIGELTCGHAYVNPGEYKKPEAITMGLLGAELAKDNSGFYRINKILKGAPYSNKLRSPLSEQGIDAKEGNYIVAINGVPTNTTDNIYSMLIGTADQIVELSINTKPALAGARKVNIKPISNEDPLYHLEWLEDNIKKVEKATNGRVGYVYIPDMGVDGLNEFSRYFYPQIDKEALIVDDRYNGGGNISPMIIERLLRKPYRMTMARTTTMTGTVPDAAIAGPKVLLINKYSASDGDLFAWSFKATKLGKVIGTRTWGGIIGISGSLPYMDDTDIRVPFFTNYDVETGKWIVENHGVDPDILLENDPIKEQMGEDEQLNKAIEVIMDELKDRKPLPKTPEPRTLKDLGVMQ